MSCIKDENLEVLQGLLYDSNRKSINIEIKSCNEKDLQPGESCMNDEEFKDYFRSKAFIFQILHTYIDYDDIENPVKTIPGKLSSVSMIPGTQQTQ